MLARRLFEQRQRFVVSFVPVGRIRSFEQIVGAALTRERGTVRFGELRADIAGSQPFHGLARGPEIAVVERRARGRGQVIVLARGHGGPGHLETPVGLVHRGGCRSGHDFGDVGGGADIVGPLPQGVALPGDRATRIDAPGKLSVPPQDVRDIRLQRIAILLRAFEFARAGSKLA